MDVHAATSIATHSVKADRAALLATRHTYDSGTTSGKVKRDTSAIPDDAPVTTAT